MSDLSPELQNLVDGARHGYEPTESDRKRVRALVMGGAAAGTAAATATVGASGTSVLVKIGLALGVAVAVAALVLALRGDSDAPPSSRAAEERAADAVPPTAPDETVEQAPAPLIAPTEAAPPLASVAEVPSARGTATAAVEEPEQNLAEEARILREAAQARLAGDPTRAQKLLDEHARRFPRGALGAEREATRVLVLCDQGRVAQARAIAARFLARNPSSPIAGRIRGSCAAP